VTTVPLDDVAVDGGEGSAAAGDERATGDRSTDGGPGPAERVGPPSARWWLVARWKDSGRRFLPGVSYPIFLWVLWRAVEMAVSVHLGGTPGHSAFFYDSEHYLRIMHIGYVHPRWIMPSHAFFPGLSWLGWPIWKLTDSNLFTVHAVATVTGLAAFITVWGVSREWRNERIARRAVLLFALFPSSLFLWAFYSEGLFIALGAGAVWADRRRNHWLTVALLVPIGATRSVGILIPAVMILARIIRDRRVDRWAWAYAIAGSVGLLATLAMMKAQVGDPLAFMKVQKDWGRSLSAPWTTVLQGYHNLWPHRGTVMVPALVARNFDLWCVAIVVAAVAYAAFSRRDRFPMETWMLGMAMIILPLCSSVLASFNRFVFADWIIYPVYASALDRLPRPWRILAMCSISVALIATGYAMVGRFSVGRFVG
jgi:hypothetical protein